MATQGPALAASGTSRVTIATYSAPTQGSASVVAKATERSEREREREREGGGGEVEITVKVEITKEEIPTSGRSMRGYILIFSGI